MQTLFRLFRGKKFNVLRDRNDANNFSVAELYLGVLIISLSIFLLPTVAIFYFYVFIAIILNVLCIQLLLIVLQTLVTDFPYFLIQLAIFRPYTLPKSIRMNIENNGKGIKIVSLPLDKGPIFANLISELKLLVEAQTFVNIFKSVVSGRNLFHIMRGFLHILSRVQSEDAQHEVYEANTLRSSEAHFLKQLYKISFNLYPRAVVAV